MDVAARSSSVVTPRGNDRETDRAAGSIIVVQAIRNDDGRFPWIVVIADRLTKSEIRANASLSTPELMMMRATT
jgi:hypothetical protein